MSKRVKTKSPYTNYATQAKRDARSLNVEIWRYKTGRNHLLPCEEYWTLVAPFSDEIPFLEGIGFLDQSQVHGVSRSPKDIELLTKKFPDANFYCGQWANVLNKHSPCAKGGMVYLDTSTELDTQSYTTASALTAATLSRCAVHTLVCANFCKNKPITGTEYEHSTYSENVRSFLNEEVLDCWEAISAGTKDYVLPPVVSQTQMICFYYWRNK